MFATDVSKAWWTLEAEVHMDSFLVARLGYAQLQNGWLVEAGGWGDRNNLEVIRHGILELHTVLKNSAQHTFTNSVGGRSTNWQCHTRRIYGRKLENTPGMDFGDDLS